MSQELFDLDDNRFGSPATAVMSEEEIIVKLDDTVRTGTLHFSGANLPGDSALFVADIICTRGLYSFSKADFSSCGLNGQAFEQLASCFRAAPGLQSLDLSRNDLTKESGLSIASILAGEGKLEILDVSDNKLGDAGVASLTSAFDKDISGLMPTKFLSILTLQVLDLSGNDLGDASILALSRGLLQFTKKSSAVNKPVALEVLRLDRNKLGDNSALCLAQLLQSSYATMQKSPRTTTFQLKELSISDNNVGEKGLIALLISVQETRDFSLKILKMSRCLPTVAVLDQLAEVLAVQSGIFNALSVLELDFNLASAIKAVRDPDYTETLLRLSHAVSSYDHSLSSLSLGDLYAVTLHASTDPILSSNEHVKLNSALSRLDQLGAILKITDGLVIEGESKSDAEPKKIAQQKAVSLNKFPNSHVDTPNKERDSHLEEKLDIPDGYVAARVEVLEQTAYQSPVLPPPASSSRTVHIKTPPYIANSAEHRSVLDYQQDEFQQMRQEQAVS